MIPEDGKALVEALVRLASEVEETHGEAARDLIDCAVDRLTQQADEIRKAAQEERKDRERQIRVSEYRRAIEWLHGRAKTMIDPHARAVLDLAGDEYGRARSRALSQKGEADG